MLTPQEVATTVANYVKAFIHLAFWAVVAAATAGGVFVALKTIWKFVNMAARALELHG